MPCAVKQQRDHVGALRVERTQEPQTVEAGHDQIGDHDRRTEGRDLFEGLFAVARGLRDEAPAPDELFESHSGS